MFKLTAGLLVLSLSLSVMAESEFKLSTEDMRVAAEKLNEQKENPEHSVETRRLMDKVAVSLNESADANEELENRSKAKKLLSKIGRTLGRGATWLSVQTMKPFMTAGSFATGLFEREDKNQDVAGLYRIFLSHSEEFDMLYKEAGTPEEFAELLMIKFEEIVEQKSNIIFRDVLAKVLPELKIPQDLSQIDWTKVDVSKIDEDSIDPAWINEHPEYQDLRPLIGDFTKEQLTEILLTGYYEPTIEFENVKAALPRIHELVVALVGQIVGPKIVLGMISSTLAGLYTTPVLLADVGAGVSVAICLQKNTRERFSNDEDLKQFCSYATNWSSYQLMKSRAKGYVSGKKAKSRLKRWNRARLEKREQRRQERARQRELATSA